MIKTINSSGKYTYIYNPPTNTYVSCPQSALGAGNVRFNSNLQSFEVFDGFNWLQITPSYATVGLTPDAESILDWAKEKRNAELELMEKAKTNLGIRDLLEQRSKIDEQIKVLSILTSEGGK